MYAGATANVIHKTRRVEDVGHREGDGDHQYRHTDSDEVRDEDEGRQDQLDADPAAALAFGDPPRIHDPYSGVALTRLLCLVTFSSTRPSRCAILFFAVIVPSA